MVVVVAVVVVATYCYVLQREMHVRLICANISFSP